MELGRTREWLRTADPQDVERARWHLFAGRLAESATAPFDQMRRVAEIDAIKDPRRREREADSFNKARVNSVIAAQREQAETRLILMLDDDVDEPDDEGAPDGG